MKPLIPSHKENKRYLLVTGKNLKSNVEKAILDYIGTLGYSKASPNIIKTGKNWLILAINRESINDVRGALTIWPDKMSVEKVSGTLRGIKDSPSSSKRGQTKGLGK